MDYGNDYILMCTEAEEIQKEHILANGDFEVRLTYGRGQVEVHHHREITAYYKPDNHLWLPRQDQLQEMLINESDEDVTADAITKLLEYFNDFALSVCPQFPSMEQLWLAFCMKSLYSKTWDGEAWKTN